MSMTFTKLFSSITASTIWAEPDHTRLVWITMLAMADQHGRVWGSIPGLANMARVDIERCEAALQALMSPDKYSRTKTNEGRRIEEIDGGWRLLNHGKYREIRDEEAIRESKRKWAERNRAKLKAEEVEKSRTESNSVDRGRAITEAEPDAEASLKDIGAAPLVAKGNAFRVPPCPYEELLAAYHAECPSMPRVQIMTNMRLKHTQSRWAQVCKDEKWGMTEALEWFKDYFKMAEKSDFLTGRASTKGRPWRADFEWLMTAGNFAKVVEGKYTEQRA